MTSEIAASVALITVGVAALAVAAYKFSRPTAEHRRAVSYLVGALTSLGLSAVILAPATLRTLAGVAPVPNLPRLVGSALAMVAAWCIYQMNAGPVRNRPSVLDRPVPGGALLACCVAAMTGLLVSSGTAFTVDFLGTYGAMPTIAAYEAIYGGYLGWVCVEFVRIVRPWIRAAGGALRAGLVTITAGACLAVGWAVWKLAHIGFRLAGSAVPAEGPVSAALAALAVVVILVGVTLTRWLPIVRAPLRAAALAVSGRRVLRFAAELESLFPELRRPWAVPPFLGARRLRPYLATVAVRDAQHHVRRYVPAGVDGQVRALRHLDPRRDVEALREAARLASAIEAYLAGRPRDGGSDVPAVGFVRSDLPAEAAAIAAMARAYRRSPVVRAVRQEAARQVGQP